MALENNNGGAQHEVLVEITDDVALIEVRDWDSGDTVVELITENPDDLRDLARRLNEAADKM